MLLSKHDHLYQGGFNMRQLALITSVCVIALLATGCSSAYKTGSWKDPEFSGQINKVYIVGVTSKDLARRIFEDEFGRHLQAHGATGISSYRDLSFEEESQEDLIKAKMAENGADAVLISRMTGRRIEEVVNPGRISGYSYGPDYRDRRYYRGYPGYQGGPAWRPYVDQRRTERRPVRPENLPEDDRRPGYEYRPGYYYRDWGNYYYRSLDVVYEPATITELEIVTIEAVLFDGESAEMIWSAEFEAYVDYNLEKMIKDYIEIVLKDFIDKGLVSKPSQ